MDMMSDDFLTDAFYKCYKECGPKKGVSSEAFFERLSCEGLCGGIAISKWMIFWICLFMDIYGWMGGWIYL